MFKIIRMRCVCFDTFYIAAVNANYNAEIKYTAGSSVKFQR